MRPRLQSDASVRPLNFTVRPHVMRITLVLTAVLALGVTLESRADPPAEAPRLSEDAAIRIALDEVERHQSLNLSAYEAPIAKRLWPGSWRVIFPSKDHTAPCLSVDVDDRTGKTDTLSVRHLGC